MTSVEGERDALRVAVERLNTQAATTALVTPPHASRRRGSGVPSSSERAVVAEDLESAAFDEGDHSDGRAFRPWRDVALRGGPMALLSKAPPPMSRALDVADRAVDNALRWLRADPVVRAAMVAYVVLVHMLLLSAIISRGGRRAVPLLP